jgi:hypothetical protein
MSMDTHATPHLRNGLTEQYARIFGPKYSAMYNEHIGAPFPSSTPSLSIKS